jgi:hypothetical protein
VRWLTEDAVIVCTHELGNVKVQTSQSLVTVGGRIALVQADPEGRAISGCPNIGATIRPCQHTLKVRTGYSTFVRVQGRPVVLDNLDGLTDGTPPGIVHYKVRAPGQQLVGSSA